MADKSEVARRLEKILHRFSDEATEADLAFAMFRRIMAAEGIKAPELRLDLDGENRASADALLRAFEKINTPSKQQICNLELRVAELEKENSKLKVEQKTNATDLRELRSIKRNYDRIKSRKLAKPSIKASGKKLRPAKARTTKKRSSNSSRRSQLELSVRELTVAASD